MRNLPGPPTVALSANYVDGSNFAAHLAELRWQAIAEAEKAQSGESRPGRSAALVQVMESGTFVTEMRSEASDVIWSEFKEPRIPQASELMQPAGTGAGAGANVGTGAGANAGSEADSGGASADAPTAESDEEYPDSLLDQMFPEID